MNNTELPIDLKKIIENEKVDFLVKAKRKYPLKKAFGTIALGLGMAAFVSLFVYAFFGPLLKDEEVHFEVNGNPVTASLADYSELILPGLIISFLVLAALWVNIYGIYLLIKKGGYIVGTETRMIQYQNGETTITNWEQFTGNVKIYTKINFGNLDYELRTGKIHSRKNQPDEFVPDIIYLAGIENIYDIEKKCKIRIKENDPTPAVLTN
jgi:hypothetical protein